MKILESKSTIISAYTLVLGILSLCLNLSSCYIFTGTSFAYGKNPYPTLDYLIQDLETNDLRFPLESSSWSVHRQATVLDASTKISISNLDTKCGSLYLMGGYEISQLIRQQEGVISTTFIRNFINLPNHQMFFFKAQLWSIDIRATSQFYGLLSLNFSPGTTYSIGYNEVKSSFYCGNASRSDRPATILGKQQHSSSSVLVSLTTNGMMNSANVTFGLRTMSLTFLPTDQGSDSLCLRTNGQVSVVTGTPVCSCPSGQFLDSSNGCTLCHFIL